MTCEYVLMVSLERTAVRCVDKGVLLELSMYRYCINDWGFENGKCVVRNGEPFQWPFLVAVFERFLCQARGGMVRA